MSRAGWARASRRARLAIAASVFAALGAAAYPCTLFSASGSSAEGGGTLVAKNRDWTPDSVDRVELVKPAKGYAYLALMAGRRAKGGVNSAGFAAFSASASSIPRAERREGGSRALEALLNGCGSVDEALGRGLRGFVGARPAFYLVGDRRSSAWIEVATGGEVATRRIDSGTLWHTNHFLDPGLARCNARIGESSAARAARIGELLDSEPALSFADFVRFGQDRNAGPDLSIWRSGAAPGKERTLASVVVGLPPAGPIRFRAELANEGEERRVIELDLGEAFWSGPPRSW